MQKRLLIFGLLALGGLAYAEKPFPVNGSQQQEHSQPHADAAQPNTPQLCATEVCKENADNAERYAYYKAHPKEYLKTAVAPANLSNWILAGLGMVGGFAAIITLVLIKRQADIMEAQSNDARESGAKATEIALATAQAAKESAKAANAQIQMVKDKERAQISVFITDKEFEVDVFYVVRVKIANDGTTSAFNTLARGYVTVHPSDTLPPMWIFLPLAVPSTIRGINEPATAEITFIDQPDLRKVNTEIPYFIHVGGVVEYDDVFGDSHKTTFRYRLKVSTIEQIPDTACVKIKSFYEWERCGSSEENHAT